MTKPADFYLGVVDFFAVLLPGAGLVYVLQPLLVAQLPVPWLPAGDAPAWALFLVLAYIAGHLLHAAGSWLLDGRVYRDTYLRRRQADHCHTIACVRENGVPGLAADPRAAGTLLGRVYLTGVDTRGTNCYDWCLSRLRLIAPAGAAEVDRVQADSKLFRSLVFVFAATALVALLQGAPLLAAGAAVLALFALWRFCQLRWTATKRVYEYYLLATAELAQPGGTDD